MGVCMEGQFTNYSHIYKRWLAAAHRGSSGTVPLWCRTVVVPALFESDANKIECKKTCKGNAQESSREANIGHASEPTSSEAIRIGR